MVRNYKRKTTRGNYGEETLKTALRLISEGRSLKSVSKELGVPAKTLRRHRDGKVRAPGSIILGPKTVVLPPKIEHELRDYILLMEKRMYALTPVEVRRLAYHLAERAGIPHSFSKDNKMAGKDWLKKFLARNQQLSVRLPIATSLCRIEGFNKESVDRFFEMYKAVLDQTNFDETMLHRLWNIDETGINAVSTQVKVLCTKGARQVRKASSGERGKNVTVLCSMNAAGGFGVPPFFVFPRKRINPALMLDTPSGSVGCCNERGSGYMDSSLFLTWLKHFVKYMSCNKESQHIIVLDGHESHKTLQAIDFCRDNGIILISLPPHSTHRMQPLDRTFFKSLKANYRQEIEKWMMNHRGQRVTQFDIGGIFGAAYRRSATIDRAQKGFEVSGIWPYDNTRFDTDFLDTNEATALEDSQTPAKTNPPETVIQPDVHRETTAAVGSDGVGGIADLHQAISPPRVSGKAKQKRKNTKKQQSEILTSSPYKEFLVNKSKQIKLNLKRKGVTQTTAAIKKQKATPVNHDSSESMPSCSGDYLRKGNSSTSGKKDWQCIVCSEKWSESRPGEKWIKCAQCGKWAHEECTPGQGLYVCHECDDDE